MPVHGRLHPLKSIVTFVMVSAFASPAVAVQTLREAASKPVVTASAVDTQSSPRVVRKSDSLLNGALIGAGVAVASGLFMCTRMEPWEICRDDFGPMLKIGALGAGIGAGIDALIRGRVTIYESANGTTLHAAPIVGRDTKGVRLSVSF